LFELAVELRQLTRKFGAKLLINDRIDVALAVSADGVHLGKTSLSVQEARRILGSKRLIGYSTHSVNEAVMAQQGGADFVTLGPVYYTQSKAKFGEPLGVSTLYEAVRVVSIPVFALGGVKGTSAAEVMSAGAHGVALVSAIMVAPNPTIETESLLRIIAHHAV
jgi:thiamine-phosphate pyrophosphorylase